MFTDLNMEEILEIRDTCKTSSQLFKSNAFSTWGCTFACKSNACNTLGFIIA